MNFEYIHGSTFGCVCQPPAPCNDLIHDDQVAIDPKDGQVEWYKKHMDGSFEPAVLRSNQEQSIICMKSSMEHQTPQSA